jgi:hypothetical protein
MAVESTEGDGYNWEVSWQGHSTAQLRRLAALPFSEKLKWLEEAHRLVLRMELEPKKKSGQTQNRRDSDTT